MARSDASLPSKEVGTIPSGLNRIKTGREQTSNEFSSFDQTSDRKHDSKAASSSSSSSAVTPMTRKSRQKTHHLKFGVLPRGLSRGKKISLWLASYLSKDHSRASSPESSTPKDAPTTNRKANNKESYMRSGKQQHNGGKDPPVKPPPSDNKKRHEIPKDYKSGKQHSGGKDPSAKPPPSDNKERHEIPKDYKSVSCELGRGVHFPPNLKSFSHELGRGIDATFGPPKAYNHRDLKELLGSSHLKFDEAKGVVNVELSSFNDDVVNYLKENDGPFTGREIAKDLLLLTQRCIEMPTYEFREKCEGIVQDLRERRQLCPTGLLKWLVTHMLFILTRCTRLLQFQKDIEPVNSIAFYKFKHVLESVPSLDMNWLPDSETDSTDVGTNYIQRGISEDVGTNYIQRGISEDDTRIKLKTLKRDDDDNNKLPVSASEQDSTSDGSQSVICRICEEIVPVANLEFHSYICAHAEKCDMACLSVNERLSKLTELLEQIIESCNNNNTGCHLYSSLSSPEILKLTPTKSLGVSEGGSPKVLSEWQNKGVEGMFEDLHGMDTAYIEDSCTTASIFTKGPLAIKLGSCGPSSTNGSMTPGSSSTTPRAAHFDFWLEQYNPCRLEDVQQMRGLADVAHKAVMADVSEDCSCEILFACMVDLQEILQRSILKALVVDTFGRRIESLLREKYLLFSESTDALDEENNKRNNKCLKVIPDDASQSSAMATPVNFSNKERIRIDDFHIIKPISSGAYGRVFLARKRTTGDFFAIKVLNKLDIIRKNDIERILAERNILIAVRNPFMVRFYYSFTSKDNLYLVMEYLNGGDLYSLLRKVGCLDEDVARIYIAELVLALEYLHSIDIVHRDLKPDNILIAQDGHIKLTDFGLSKYGLMNSTTNLYGADNEHMASPGTSNLSTLQSEEEKRQSAVGTPDYLAPEILLGMDHGFGADWWSVGIVLFELINGIPPFSADCPEEIFGNILNRKIPWPPSSSDMSIEVRDLVDRLLLLDPAERLGAKGASEVKAHPFFKGINWDTLSSSEAAFVPQPETVDDTSYFVPRYAKSFRVSGHNTSDDSASETGSCSSNDESQGDGCSNYGDFESSPLNFLSFNFSFKNLSQLASINHEMLRRSGKDQASLVHSHQEVGEL